MLYQNAKRKRREKGGDGGRNIVVRYEVYEFSDEFAWKNREDAVIKVMEEDDTRNTNDKADSDKENETTNGPSQVTLAAVASSLKRLRLRLAICMNCFEEFDVEKYNSGGIAASGQELEKDARRKEITRLKEQVLVAA